MKVVLTIAGSDSSGGAGIQADLKSFEAFGVFGTSVVTVLTAQNTQGVTEIFPVDAQFVKKQLEAVQADFEIAAIKIGMLFSNDIIEVVKQFIEKLDIPIVFDPVFISKAGSKLLNDDAIEKLRSLLDLSSVATPNLFEAKALFGHQNEIIDETSLLQAPCPVVVKNQLQTSNTLKSIDTLYFDGNQKDYESPYIQTTNTHGTGCSFSSAIAANLALGRSLDESITLAKAFIHEAIKHAPNLGHGMGPIAHKRGGELVKT